MIAFIFSPLGRYLMIGLAAVAIVGGAYIKGRGDGRDALQAKLDRQIAREVATGNNASAEALKKFDANKDLEDDEFMRKD
jgi:hypothetical protein